MSLLDATRENCTLLDRISVSDVFGGITHRWEDGATFGASIAFDSSTEGLTAQAAGATALYSVFTDKSVVLEYHDVFRRESDGKIFRVTSDGEDDKTPKTAGLNLRKVRAEKWVIPDAL